jgi:hypothetical protein
MWSFQKANFPELKGSQPGRGNPFSSAKRDSLDQDFFLTRPKEYKENDKPLTKLRKNSGDSLLECSNPGSGTYFEKRIEKEPDMICR